MNFIIRTLTVCSTLFLMACAAPTKQQTSATTTTQWQDLGFIQNNSIRVSYDKNSIQRTGFIATLRERKTILSPQAIFALDNLPDFKTAEMTWSFHCANHTFRLEQLLLIDVGNKVITSYHYPNQPQRYQNIPMNSLAERQFKLACAPSL